MKNIVKYFLVLLPFSSLAFSYNYDTIELLGGTIERCSGSTDDGRMNDNFGHDSSDQATIDPSFFPGSDPSSYTPIEYLDPEKMDPILY